LAFPMVRIMLLANFWQMCPTNETIANECLWKVASNAFRTSTDLHKAITLVLQPRRKRRSLKLIYSFFGDGETETKVYYYYCCDLLSKG